MLLAPSGSTTLTVMSSTHRSSKLVLKSVSSRSLPLGRRYRKPSRGVLQPVGQHEQSYMYEEVGGLLLRTTATLSRQAVQLPLWRGQHKLAVAVAVVSSKALQVCSSPNTKSVFHPPISG